ncbi:hypothetical protein BDF21DRAFT_425802, partial [Thamnidium elegans]
MFSFLKQSDTELFEKGKTHFDNQNYSKALEYFVKSHEAGHLASKTYIGKMYYDGLGMTKDYNTALIWYKLAADVEEPASQYMIAIMYHEGKVGSNPDYQQALEWYQKSAKNGYISAMKCFALMHFEGQGTAKNHRIALYWFKEAFDKGDSDTVYLIALIYLLGGHGVDRDFDLAEIWCMKIVAKETPQSMLITGMLYGFRDDSKQSWEKAFEWMTKAAKYNVGAPQMLLGNFYLDGLGCEKDYNLAIEWYKKAAENGERTAIAQIAIMYHYGYGVPVNYNEALRLYQKAGDCGEALNGIGILYQGGLGVYQSHSAAMFYFEKVIEMDLNDAFNSIGDVYKYGYDRDMDLEMAFNYYTKSANSFDKDGMLNLGLMYMEGSGTKANKDQALYWLRRADLFGKEEAKKFIDEIVA